MATVGMEIKKELRPCMVCEKGKALFHMWEEHSEIVPLSHAESGLLEGVLNFVMGIVELENGQIIKVNPTSIRFIDNRMEEYAFTDTGSSDT